VSQRQGIVMLGKRQLVVILATAALLTLLGFQQDSAIWSTLCFAGAALEVLGGAIIWRRARRAEGGRVRS
jgi:hypothetical protein